MERFNKAQSDDVMYAWEGEFVTLDKLILKTFDRLAMSGPVKQSDLVNAVMQTGGMPLQRGQVTGRVVACFNEIARRELEGSPEEHLRHAAELEQFRKERWKGRC